MSQPAKSTTASGVAGSNHFYQSGSGSGAGSGSVPSSSSTTGQKSQANEPVKKSVAIPVERKIIWVNFEKKIVPGRGPRLPWITEGALKQMFGPTVVRTCLIRHVEAKCPIYAYVEFKSEEEATVAIKRTNGMRGKTVGDPNASHFVLQTDFAKMHLPPGSQSLSFGNSIVKTPAHMKPLIAKAVQDSLIYLKNHQEKNRNKHKWIYVRKRTDGKALQHRLDSRQPKEHCLLNESADQNDGTFKLHKTFIKSRQRPEPPKPTEIQRNTFDGKFIEPYFPKPKYWQPGVRDLRLKFDSYKKDFSFSFDVENDMFLRRDKNNKDVIIERKQLPIAISVVRETRSEEVFCCLINPTFDLDKPDYESEWELDMKEHQHSGFKFHGIPPEFFLCYGLPIDLVRQVFLEIIDGKELVGFGLDDDLLKLGINMRCGLPKGITTLELKDTFTMKCNNNGVVVQQECSLSKLAYRCLNWCIQDGGFHCPKLDAKACARLSKLVQKAEDIYDDEEVSGIPFKIAFEKLNYEWLVNYAFVAPTQIKFASEEYWQPNSMSTGAGVGMAANEEGEETDDIDFYQSQQEMSSGSSTQIVVAPVFVESQQTQVGNGTTSATSTKNTTTTATTTYQASSNDFYQSRLVTSATTTMVITSQMPSTIQTPANGSDFDKSRMVTSGQTLFISAPPPFSTTKLAPSTSTLTESQASQSKATASSSASASVPMKRFMESEIEEKERMIEELKATRRNLVLNVKSMDITISEQEAILEKLKEKVKRMKLD